MRYFDTHPIGKLNYAHLGSRPKLLTSRRSWHWPSQYNALLSQITQIFSGLVVNCFSKDTYFMDERFPQVSFEFAQLFFLFSGNILIITKQIIFPSS